MSVHFIVSVTIDNQADRQPYDLYIEKVRPIVERFGGTYLVRSENITLLAGDWRPDRVIVIAFEGLTQLQACFASPEYKEIEALRVTTVKASAVIVGA